MSKLKALNLFDGGKKGVYERMAIVIRDGLHDKVDEIATALKKDIQPVINAIAENLGIKGDVLTRIYHNKANGEVNYELFSRLEIPLKLSIHRVLGKPIKLDKPEVKKIWEKELVGHPMLRAAAIITHNHEEESNVTPNELELYVILRAIGEL